MVRAERKQSIELFSIRFLIVFYFLIAHFAMYAFWFSGLKIQYINHESWPYRKMWREFYTGDFDSGWT